MFKHVFIFCLFSIHIIDVIGQSTAKFNPKAGFSVFKIADEADLSEKRAHSTLHAGFDVLVEQNNWLFIPGFHYYRMGLNPEDFRTSEIFSRRSSAHHIKMPVSVGYHFVPSSALSLSVYTGSNFNFFISVDDNDSGFDNGTFTGVQVHGHVGVQALILSHITLDIKYEHGYLPILKVRDRSKIRGPSISLGFIF